MSSVFSEGPAALEKMQDLLCGCIGTAKCSVEEKYPCRQDRLDCSEVCRCEGEEQCGNPENDKDIVEYSVDCLD
jgi:hypothetical protein